MANSPPAITFIAGKENKTKINIFKCIALTPVHTIINIALECKDALMFVNYRLIISCVPSVKEASAQSVQAYPGTTKATITSRILRQVLLVVIFCIIKFWRIQDLRGYLAVTIFCQFLLVKTA